MRLMALSPEALTAWCLMPKSRETRRQRSGVQGFRRQGVAALIAYLSEPSLVICRSWYTASTACESTAAQTSRSSANPASLSTRP